MTRVPFRKLRLTSRNALGRWRTDVEPIEQNVRAELALGPSDVVPPRELVQEVIRLADPHEVDGRDAVIPGGRHDLARAWIEARLSGRATTPGECLALARDLAPAPNAEPAHFHPRSKSWRYRDADAFEGHVRRAAEKAFADEPKPFTSVDRTVETQSLG